MSAERTDVAELNQEVVPGVEAGRAVTMQDVARYAGVSPKTVSNVVNDYQHVSAKTRTRVQEALTALGYRLNTTARNLRTGRTGMIGLAIPDLGESYFGELANEMVDAADKRGLSVLIEPTRADASSELDVLGSGRRSMTDALIISPLLLNAQELRDAKPIGPVVLLGERLFGAGRDHVTMANIEGARAATELLIARGSRRIAVVGAPANLDALPDLSQVRDDRVEHQLTTSSEALRIEGYRRALEAAGIPFDPELLLPTGPWRRASGAAALERALDAGLEFDGVFGLNDAVALGALHVLEVREVNVPGDVQVIGFDDIDESSYSTPALTTIAPGRAQIAAAALDLVLRRLAGEESPAELVVLPFTVVERATTRATDTSGGTA